MDPTPDDHLDFGDEECGGSQKMQFHGGGTIPALADDEMMGEDDEYDDLYNDVNVGEGFLQMQQYEAHKPPDSVVNGVSQAPGNSTPEPKVETITPPEMKPGLVSTGLRFPEQKSGYNAERGPDQAAASSAEKARPPSMTHDATVSNMGFQPSVAMSHRAVSDPVHEISGKVANESLSLLNSGSVGGSRAPVMPTHQMSSNANPDMNHPMINENQMRPAIENGYTMLFVGELHWWTTDADIESVLVQYGKVKEIKFFDDRASGKSKGYCQVEFYDPAAASACKEGMNGHIFNGRPCVVAYATPQTIKQMGSSYINKTPTQVQTQPVQGRRPMNEGLNRGSGTNFPGGGDAGRNFGRGGWGRGGQGMANRGPVGGPGRGRGVMAAKNMIGNVPGPNVGMGVGAYGQGLAGPGFGGPPGLMHPQGMMGPGFDPGYMGRGAGYGGFSGPAFPGIIPPFPAVNPMGLAGVAPHVNPAFFGRGMGMMGGTTGMDGPHQGMWTDTSTGGGWEREEHERRTRESSYGGDDNASEYGYGDASHEKGARSTAVSREKERASERISERASERDWSGNSEKRNRDERDNDRDRYDRDHRYREERDGYRDYRHKERDLDYDNERGHSSKSRSRSRAVQEDDHRSRSRDADYGKRKRLPSE